jgi:hypothetical protein
MNAIHSLVACLLLVSLTACVTAVGAGPVSIRSLAKGAFSGIREVRREVIKDKAGWEKLWAEHGKLNTPGTNAPAVDFEKEMVIAVTMGTKRTGGYAIEIAGVEVVDKKLKISVKETSPPPRAMAIQVLSAPFHFVAVPKNDLKPEFVEATANAKN